ncbi:DUF2892 domain-containing protein [Defluviimonas sp. WL0024]|uniref:DUF2892 domain-containing protein n=2 Tax=Albidovulum TaxID=205889 RepID=A0ABT3IZE4_9RHOB|nr:MULTISPECIES: DUF2892 domain-containing protein [Defluviimonas]MCU9849712.1 DUF2892 domain-containing protein [Defluviimonas sp. WL0024]MCW3780799.1 DUF2892 domain-containing protein [Defluviimonas salinarum]
MFKTNVGGADRVIRILLGIVLLGAFFAMPDLGYRWALALVGAIALLTGALSTCPLYTLLGLSTCPMKKS